MFIDSHCHINFPELSARLPEVLTNMQANQVSHAIVIGVAVQDYPAVLALAEAHPQFFATVGVHPDGKDVLEWSEDELVERAQHPKVLGIGETGLDYYHASGDLSWQQQRFRTHIRAAKRVNLPLIIHTRSAADDTLRILREEGAQCVGGVMHCFTESWPVAQAALDLGFYISFSGIVTFKNARDLQEVVAKVPLDRMLIETDAPYLAPVPHRGKTNEPAWVRYVAEHIANVRATSVEAIAHASASNTLTLFRKLCVNS